MAMTMITKCIVGIDYSTSSPCICVSVKDDYDFYYLSRIKKVTGAIEFDHGIMNGDLMPKEFDSKIEQYAFIANWAMDVLSRYDIDNVWIEDYAFAATGKVFHIGENTGILKYRLMKKEIPYHVVAPTTVKSTTVGKGNASKEDIIENFNRTFDTDIHEVLDTKTLNPVSDIADSYHICTYGIQQSILENYNT
jgi:Holliday junction resolvasome RuvABC endonuclease subunit